MREHRKNPERTGIYSVVPRAKSPNRNGIREFRPEFRRNLQPSCTGYVLKRAAVAMRARVVMAVPVRSEEGAAAILECSIDGRDDEMAAFISWLW
jgi:hypothetical protein